MKFISTVKKGLFRFSRFSRNIYKNLKNHSDLSFLSQAYVFYKLSQAQRIYLYKLRSVFQYDGTSLFLKNEIKDYFETQKITHSELRTKKFTNSGMNQWKNWLRLKNNYQYDLSQIKWSQLVPQKWRNIINEYCWVENTNLKKKKWNSYEKEQLINSNYQNANNSEDPFLLLPDEKHNFKKNYRYDVLSYKFIYYDYEAKKDSYRDSYEPLFQVNKIQVNKNPKFSYTYNYNIDKDKLIDMWWSIPITNYFGINTIMYIEKNTDRKYFDWKMLHNTNSKTEPKNYQIFDKIEKKEIFYQKIDQEINRSHQTKNLFDWMGMNEEILSRPISNLESWFFPEFVLLYNGYKMKPWAIPINLLFSNFYKSKNLSKKKNINKKKKNQYFRLSQQNKYLELENQNQYEKELAGQGDLRFNVQENSIKKQQYVIGTEFLLTRYLVFKLQLRNEESFIEQMINNIKVYCLLISSMNLRELTISSLKRTEMSMDIMMHPKNLTFTELITKGILTFEPIRLSIPVDGQFILYQTIGISLVHKRKDQNNQKKMTENRNKNYCDLLGPENLLSPRRRRELRILICLNSRNNKAVDKKPVFWNENRVKNCSQFFDESKDLDRDKNKLIKFKFFLWPNYRLEDLACMNRYWFDTNNSSRFSLLRIHMYPRFKTHL